AVLSVEPAEVSQVFFAGAGVPFCFAQLRKRRARAAAIKKDLSPIWRPPRHGGFMHWLGRAALKSGVNGGA
ncbi:MAG TPA: hypothetical protein VKO86_13150, partial [Gemmatimonadales bacterium]|nr:hypothetical protein [Gemmatimonadales bacterium]